MKALAVLVAAMIAVGVSQTPSKDADWMLMSVRHRDRLCFKLYEEITDVFLELCLLHAPAANNVWQTNCYCYHLIAFFQLNLNLLSITQCAVALLSNRILNVLTADQIAIVSMALV